MTEEMQIIFERLCFCFETRKFADLRILLLDMEPFDIALFIDLTQRIEPVCHKAVVDLLRIDLALFCDGAQHDVCCFVIAVVPDKLQQLSFGKRQRCFIATQKIALGLLKKPDILII